MFTDMDPGESSPDEAEVASLVGKLEGLKQKAKSLKLSSADGEEARHWAVVYTDLEKVSAYVQTYLVKESEE